MSNIMRLKNVMQGACRRVMLLGLYVSMGAVAQAQDGTVKKTGHGVAVTAGTMCVELECYTPSVIRVKKYVAGNAPETHSYAVTAQPEKVGFKLKDKGGAVELSTSMLTAVVDADASKVTFRDNSGRTLVTEKAATAVMNPTTDAGTPTYKVAQTFTLDPTEAIFGLGQHRGGKWSHRNHSMHMEQENMEINIPIVHSVKGYAIYWDNTSPTQFTDNADGLTFDSEVGDLIDYYMVYGGSVDGVIKNWRGLTGQAPMFPLWTFGFNQSRERYMSQDELVGVVRKYRELQVPLDGIVQDWQYWGEDHHYWNAVEFLNPRFPDPKKMMDDVHGMNAHAVISIWPSFGSKTNIHKELKDKNLLLRHTTYPQVGGVRVYDPFSPEARDIYWKYIDKNMNSIGMDGWWLDATEPEHSPIEASDYDQPTADGTYRRVRNAFPIVSVGGVYDHQRAQYSDKRVFILTRSAFAGQQRYGAASWSGDIVSSWQVLREQIASAVNFTMSGIPYWNSDIGGFFADRVYPEGNKDHEYQELYVRWMQFGAFTGMMRSHGTSTPREIYLFGHRGEPIFDAQEQAINLRYRLLPYTYSASWDVTANAGSLMRPLFADFVTDGKAVGTSDEFMFGKSFLIAPVVDKADSRQVYLPKAAQWYDFWTGTATDGGQTITANAPLNRIPVYVRAGSVVPFGPTVQYASEKKWDDLQIRVYPGADGEFTLYEDEGDNYNYEQGKYTTINMKWNDRKRTLTISAREGEGFDGMLTNRKFRVVLVDANSGTGLDNTSTTQTVDYSGKKIVVKL